METYFACQLILPRWEQFGHQTHATLESARVEALQVVRNYGASAVEIVKVEQVGSGASIRFNHSVVETVHR